MVGSGGNAIFHPGRPDGRNGSLSYPSLADQDADSGAAQTIEARTGRAVRLRKGDRLTIINPSGSQVCDFWAFKAANLLEYMSMAHTHTTLGSIFPKPGDVLVTNARQPILQFEEDTSPGVHDTLIAACDAARYQQLGCEDYHDNCTDNLRMALMSLGLEAPAIPAPFNVWMNCPLLEDGSVGFAKPVSKPGDRVTFRALADCVAVMSACPQDVTPVNGEGGSTSSLEFTVTRG